ncbi:uncharacterized protein K444DRAFT_211106 [Hyaloscypha bicolor E]|uniref:Uncharacterized protein n=1 Tax=Hyaloscypha bicolor E TaxID=1095630 RepID=A0A2J6TPS0_9HELO|nr:uncharacterized protein K444DRAFT_211106 [Hyaloscypha bicolor E]PMD65016.1 hypothetical protein K444DRAFT_211106 [Hyaloscypha bicolor E]
MGPDGLKSGRDHKTGPYLHAHRAFSPAAGRGCRDGQQKCVTSKHATLDRPLSIQLTIVQFGTSSGKKAENLLSGKSNHFELAIASMVQGDTPLSLLLLFRLPHFLLSARGLIPGHWNSQFGGCTHLPSSRLCRSPPRTTPPNGSPLATYVSEVGSDENLLNPTLEPSRVRTQDVETYHDLKCQEGLSNLICVRCQPCRENTKCLGLPRDVGHCDDL